MGPKPKKKPKTHPKSSTAAKESVPLRKSPRIAQSEDSDRSDQALNPALSAYSGSTEIIPPTAINQSPVLNLQIGDNPDLNQIPTSSFPGISPGGNGGGNNSDMESLNARIQQLETEVRARPVGVTHRQGETSPIQSAMPMSHESGRPIAPNCSKRRRELSSISSDDDDDEKDDDGEDTTTRNSMAKKFVYTKPPKTAKMIPPFTGEKELWAVWFARFEAITAQWTHNEKLSAMLALLQGSAGEYVFDILPAKVRVNYNLLVREMTSRFKKIISLTSYRNKYAKIKQKSTQSLEELAAVIRKMYEKAYPDREPQTKREDLLRKFLDSLYDPKTRLTLEYFKEPKSIEEALEKAIAYEDAKGEKSPKAKVRRIDTEEMSAKDILETVLADAQDCGSNGPSNGPSNTMIKDQNNGTNEAMKKLETQMATLLKQNDEKQKRIQAKPRKVRRGNIQQTRVPPSTRDNEVICWNCSRVGHIS